MARIGRSCSVAVLSVLLLVVTACGGSSKSSYCATVERWQKTLSTIPKSASARNVILRTKDELADLQRAAPREIKSDYILTVSKFNSAVGADTPAGDIAAKMLRLEADPAFVAAGKRIDAYNSKACGIKRSSN